MAGRNEAEEDEEHMIYITNSAGCKAKKLLTTRAGRLDVKGVAELFHLEVSSIMFDNMRIPLDRHGISAATWGTIRKFTGPGLGETEDTPIVVTGEPAVRHSLLAPVVKHNVLQSDQDNRVYVNLHIQNVKEAQKRGCHASVVFDTGFTGDLLLSKYKADQLFSRPPPGSSRKCLKTLGGVKLFARSYGYIPCCVLLQEDEMSIMDSGNSAHLELLAMEQSSLEMLMAEKVLPRPHMMQEEPEDLVKQFEEDMADCSAWNKGTGLTDADRASREKDYDSIQNASRDVQAAFEKEKEAGYVLQVSPIKNGMDRSGTEALIGCPAMKRLNVGIDPLSHRLCKVDSTYVLTSARVVA